MLLILILFFAIGGLTAQSIEGKITDQATGESLPGVVVILTSPADTSFKLATISSPEGKFYFTKLTPGSYVLQAEMLGYKKTELKTDVGKAATIVTIKMPEDIKLLQEVEIQGTLTRMVMKGDTSEYNAAAYKTNPDATAEDLIRKMNGLSSENGVIKAQGEEVIKVLVDGQEFFSDDPNMALKNIPATAIDKIQVIDRKNEKDRFTGIDKGETEKTINIVTKPEMRKSIFGKAYAGYGTDDRYSTGASIHYFNDKQRISVMGMSNNINQQNFSPSDLSTAVGGDDRPRGGRSSRRNRSESNLTSGGNNGINTTHSIGMNYSDQRNKNNNITGSYFFNKTDNVTQSVAERNYVPVDSGTQLYRQTTDNNSAAINHKMNMRWEHTFDSSNSIVITPRLNITKTENNNFFDASTNLLRDTLLNPLNRSISRTLSKNLNYTAGTDVLLRHRFAKAKRTISLNVSAEAGGTDYESVLNSQNSFFGTSPSDSLINQQSTTVIGKQKLGTELTYTEPVGKKNALEITGFHEITAATSEKTTFSAPTGTDQFTLLDSVLSNRFNNTINVSNAALNFVRNTEKLELTVGLKGQQTVIDVEQNFPNSFTLNRSFNNLLPLVIMKYHFTKQNSIRIYFRNFTQSPDAENMQSVINNTNPLQLTVGNPNLKQEYTRGLFIFYGFNDDVKSRNLFLFFMARFTEDYLTNSTFIARADTFITDKVLLRQGGQLIKNINMPGHRLYNLNFNYGQPLKSLKSNWSFTANLNYTRTPSLLNGRENFTNDYTGRADLMISSNISERIDFRLEHSYQYNSVLNSLQENLNSDYHMQQTSGTMNLMPNKHWVLRGELKRNAYTGLGEGFDRQIWLVNAGLGYKFLPREAGELTLNVYDIFKQNNSIARNVTSSYVENTQTNIITRYFMLTFTYNIRKMASGNRENKAN